jgi:hypothetical protein
MTQNISLQKIVDVGLKSKIVALQQAMNMFFVLILTQFFLYVSDLTEFFRANFENYKILDSGL